MPSTLKQANEVLRRVKVVRHPSCSVDGLLGSFSGIIPSDKTSTRFIKELRENLYGKNTES